MSYAHRSCKGCQFYKQMGEKGFCFKHSKLLPADAKGCDDFKLKADRDLKKRWFPGEKSEEKKHEPQGFDQIRVTPKPEGSKGFMLHKKEVVKNRLYIDTEGGEEKAINREIQEYEQEQKIFLLIIIGGLIIIFALLMITGVI